MTISSTQRRQLLVAALRAIDLTVVTTSLIATLVLTSHETTVRGWWSFLQIRLSLANMLFGVAYVLTWIPVLAAQRLYDSHRLAPVTTEISRIAVAVLIAVTPLVPLRYLLQLEALGLDAIAIFGAMVLTGLVVERRLLRLLARALRARGRNLRQVLFIGDGVDAAPMAKLFARREALGYRLAATVRTDELDGGDAEDAIMAQVDVELHRHAVDEVFVSLPLIRSRSLVERLVSLCDQEGITMRVFSRVAELQWSWASIDSLMGQPILTISATRPREAAMVAKRALDVVLSAVAIAALAPLCALIALAIKLDSRGPVLFAQERVGLNRRRFHALKFRTMVPDAEAMQRAVEHLNEADGPVFKIQDDPRITGVGRFLRRTSLDEIPQLVNVLRGEMSLVGPRPLPVRDFERIETRWHRRRFSVKPGITCLWQIESREPKFNEWVRKDMEYIDNWSFALDLKILAKTIPAVLSRHGAH